MTTRTVDLEKEGKRARKPAAGYPLRVPEIDSVVKRVNDEAKKLKKHPAQR